MITLFFLEYLDISIDFSHSVLIIGDFNIPEFAECVSTSSTTGLYSTLLGFLSLHKLKQQNSIVNSNNRILNLLK